MPPAPLRFCVPAARSKVQWALKVEAHTSTARRHLILLHPHCCNSGRAQPHYSYYPTPPHYIAPVPAAPVTTILDTRTAPTTVDVSIYHPNVPTCPDNSLTMGLPPVSGF